MQQGLRDLEQALGTSTQYDHRTVQWTQVQRSRYLIHQFLRYDYPGPISNLKQRLMVLPPERYGDQRQVAHRLLVSTPGAETHYQRDAFGNRVVGINVARVEQRIDFEAWILVERVGRHGPHYVPTRWLRDPRLLEPSALTRPDEALEAVAINLRSEGRKGLDLAKHIMAWVYRHISYTHDATGIKTTAAQAYILQHGVCQDYAHLMIALCRLCAIPARYVSGHMLGEGGTHAWVEVIVPAKEGGVAQVVALDPTHDREAGLSYLTIAVGRDYFDVAPTSGSYEAAYSGQLSGRKRVDLTQLDYAETRLQDELAS